MRVPDLLNTHFLDTSPQYLYDCEMGLKPRQLNKASGSLYEQVRDRLSAPSAQGRQPAVESSRMFGKRCLKIGGKAFAAEYLTTMVFKLTGEEHRRALELPGATLWDPSGRNRPMKEWVQVPADCYGSWLGLAQSARNYVVVANLSNQ